jgi:hypothetical protein
MICFGKFRKAVKLTFIVMLVTFTAKAQKSDSLSTSTLLITPRLNSAGYFPFSGAYLNKHTNTDLNIFYQQKHGFGFFIFQSVDLEDRTSFVNYLQPGVFKKFKLSSALQVGLFGGYVFSQTDGFRDQDSDYFSAMVFYLTVNPNLKLESCSLFFDFNHSSKVANRFLATYALKGFQFEGYVWHRTVFETNQHAVSASLAINPPKAKITDKVSIQTTISYMGYLTESKPDFAMRAGFIFSVAVPIVCR